MRLSTLRSCVVQYSKSSYASSVHALIIQIDLGDGAAGRFHLRDGLTQTSLVLLRVERVHRKLER